MLNLKNQLEVQKNQVRTLEAYQKSNLTFDECVSQLISLQNKTHYGASSLWTEWAVSQLQNNHLPNNSSGSFMTALSDIDYIYESGDFEHLTTDEIAKTAAEFNL